MIDQLQKDLNAQKEALQLQQSGGTNLIPNLKSCLKNSSGSSVHKSLELNDAVLNESDEVENYNELENKLKAERRAY